MKYSSCKHINPRDDKSPSKFHPCPVYIDSLNLKTLAEEVSHSISMTPADVKAVIEELVIILQRNLIRGAKIKIEGLGTFKISFGGTGHENADEISAADISGVHITFVADPDLKKFIVANISFEKAKQNDAVKVEKVTA